MDSSDKKASTCEIEKNIDHEGTSEVQKTKDFYGTNADNAAGCRDDLPKTEQMKEAISSYCDMASMLEVEIQVKENDPLECSTTLGVPNWQQETKCEADEELDSSYDSCLVIDEERDLNEDSEFLDTTSEPHSPSKGGHLVKKGAEENRFSCPECNYRGPHSSVLNRHIRAEHRKDKPYSCPLCDFSSSRPNTIKVHVKEIHQEPKKCSQCDFIALKAHVLKRHIKSAHEKEIIYVCKFCGFNTNRCCYFKHHTENNHNQEKVYPCPSCDFTSKWPGSIRNHILAVHKKERPYQCQECDYKASVKSCLARHTRSIHRKEKPYQCCQCAQMFSRPDTLRVHGMICKSVGKPKRKVFHQTNEKADENSLTLKNGILYNQLNKHHSG